MERNGPISDLGGIGWTGGEDSAACLLHQPHLTSTEAKGLAVQSNHHPSPQVQAHSGIAVFLTSSSNPVPPTVADHNASPLPH